MHADPLPFSLEPLQFPCPALAALAGRLPLGGGREVALAALVVTRLALGLVGPDALSAEVRTARAAGAKVWLASVALPAATRVPFARCLDATAGTPAQLAGALRSLVAVAGPHLDGPSVRELERVMRQLATVA